MQIFSSDRFVLPLPAGHRFPMQKYARLRQRVSAANLTPSNELCTPPAATDEQILRAHDWDYWYRVQTGQLTAAEQRRIGFPWSEALVERTQRSAGATIAACRAALRDGISVNLAGGTHHACRDHGEGFCVLNDSAIAARALQAEDGIARVVILDCDVHQGNGTAAILAGDSTVFTFSIHGAKNFPFRKAPSDLDIELEDGCDDASYLAALENGLQQAIGRARANLAIYLAGADPFEGDTLGRLAVSKAGLAQRDRMVFEACRRAGLPVAVTMAGGYARQIEDTVDIHFHTVQAAAALAAQGRVARLPQRL